MRDHVVAVPLAAMLHILNQSVPDFSNLDAGENLRDLVLFYAVPPLLHVLQRLLHCLLLHVRVQELLLG